MTGGASRGTVGPPDDSPPGGTAAAQTPARFDDHVPFLARLEHQERVALLELGRPIGYAPKSVLVHQDDASDHVIVILDGWTKVTRSAATGYEALLALRGPGNIVGEASAVSGRPRSATVTALGEVEAVTIQRDRFVAHLQSFPATALGSAERCLRTPAHAFAVTPVGVLAAAWGGGGARSQARREEQVDNDEVGAGEGVRLEGIAGELGVGSPPWYGITGGAIRLDRSGRLRCIGENPLPRACCP